MDKLKRAKEYFLNNTTSVELENVTSLFNAGCDTLNNHFKNLIRRHSSPMKPIDLIDLIYIEDDSSNEEFSASSIKQLPPKTREELNIIVTWLDQNLRREYMALYSDERSDVVSRSLQLLKGNILCYRDTVFHKVVQLCYSIERVYEKLQEVVQIEKDTDNF